MENACTTPFIREILTHHAMCSAAFPRQTKLYWEYVDQFVRDGLLVRNGDIVMGNEGALQVYMDALGAVPLPKCKWVIE